MHSLNSTKFKNGKTLVTFTCKSSMQRTPSFDEHKAKQECIPVGCIPPKVSRGICRERGGRLCQACPPATHTPPVIHAPFHACPLPCMPPATYAHLPCMPPLPHTPPCHACLPAIYPPAMDVPLKPPSPVDRILHTRF